MNVLVNEQRFSDMLLKIKFVDRYFVKKSHQGLTIC
jgi:hypothetical protein